MTRTEVFMFRAKLAAALVLVVLACLFGGPAVCESRPSASQAQPARESWQKEFEDVCSKTDDAMTFSDEELTDLIRRCDKLQPQIEKLDESRKKVYMGRLRMCRGLYAYVLDAKRNENK